MAIPIQSGIMASLMAIRSLCSLSRPITPVSKVLNIPITEIGSIFFLMMYSMPPQVMGRLMAMMSAQMGPKMASGLHLIKINAGKKTLKMPDKILIRGCCLFMGACPDIKLKRDFF